MEHFLIKFHPQIIASLLAIKSFFVNLIINKVGGNPAIPGIAEIVISALILYLMSSKELTILVFEFLNLNLIFLNITGFVTTKYSGLYRSICLQTNL